MNTIILRTAANYLLPLLLLFSVFILLRGHYQPGGGFTGGLIAAVAFVLHALAHGSKSTRKLLVVHPGYLVPVGLTLALVNASLPMLVQKPLMTGLWLAEPIPVVGSVGTALFFDIGVYFVVIGVVLSILLTLIESSQG